MGVRGANHLRIDQVTGGWTTKGRGANPAILITFTHHSKVALVESQAEHGWFPAIVAV